MATTDGKYGVGETWGALRKSWKGYRIAKAEDDEESMLKYARQIRTLQKRLGIAISRFPNLDLTKDDD